MTRPDGPTRVRELQNRLAGAAAHIEDSFSDPGRKRRDGAQPQGRKLKVQQVRDLGPGLAREIGGSRR